MSTPAKRPARARADSSESEASRENKIRPAINQYAGLFAGQKMFVVAKTENSDLEVEVFARLMCEFLYRPVPSFIKVPAQKVVQGNMRDRLIAYMNKDRTPTTNKQEQYARYQKNQSLFEPVKEVIRKEWDIILSVISAPTSSRCASLIESVPDVALPDTPSESAQVSLSCIEASANVSELVRDIVDSEVTEPLLPSQPAIFSVPARDDGDLDVIAQPASTISSVPARDVVDLDVIVPPLPSLSCVLLPRKYWSTGVAFALLLLPALADFLLCLVRGESPQGVRADGVRVHIAVAIAVGSSEPSIVGLLLAYTVEDNTDLLYMCMDPVWENDMSHAASISHLWSALWRTTMLHHPRPRRMSFTLAVENFPLAVCLLLDLTHLEAALTEWKSRNPCHRGCCASSMRLLLTRDGSAPDNPAFVIPKIAGYSGMSRDCILLLLRGMKNIGCPSFETPGWLHDVIGDRTLRLRMLIVDDLGSPFVSQLVSWVKSVWPQVDMRIQHTPPQPGAACGYIAASAVAEMIRCEGTWFDSLCASRFRSVGRGNAGLKHAFAKTRLTDRQCTCHQRLIALQLSQCRSEAHWLTGVEVEYLAALWAKRPAGLRSWSGNQICHTIVCALERFLDPEDGVLHESTSEYGGEHVTCCMVNTEPSSHSGTHWIAVGFGFAFGEPELLSSQA